MPKAILSVHDKTGLVEFARGLAHLGWTLLASGGTARAAARSRAARHRGGRLHRLARDPGRAGEDAAPGHPRRPAGPPDRSRRRPNCPDWAGITSTWWRSTCIPSKQTIAKPGRHPGGRDREHRHRRGHPDPRRGQEPRARHPGVRPGRLRRGAGRTAKRAAFSPRRAGALAVKGFAADRPLRCRHLRLPERRAKPCSLHALPGAEAALRRKPAPSGHAVFLPARRAGPLGGKVLQGKELSYNNLLDLDAAWKAAVSFRPSRRCASSSIFPPAASPSRRRAGGRLPGGPGLRSGLGLRRRDRQQPPVRRRHRRGHQAALFVECIIAPGFSPEALAILATKKNLRLVEMPDLSVAPGFRAALDQPRPAASRASTLATRTGTEWKVVSTRQPTEAEWAALRFAWKACQHVKSNAIVFAQGEATVGIGGGQPNRVDCVRIAVQRAGEKAQGAVMASDAFFPFPDSVTEASAGRHHRRRPPGRLDARRRNDRRRRRGRHGHGRHRRAPFPALSP